MRGTDGDPPGSGCRVFGVSPFFSGIFDQEPEKRRTGPHSQLSELRLRGKGQRPCRPVQTTGRQTGRVPAPCSRRSGFGIVGAEKQHQRFLTDPSGSGTNTAHCFGGAVEPADVYFFALNLRLGALAGRNRNGSRLFSARSARRRQFFPALFPLAHPFHHRPFTQPAVYFFPRISTMLGLKKFPSEVLIVTPVISAIRPPKFFSSSATMTRRSSSIRCCKKRVASTMSGV